MTVLVFFYRFVPENESNLQAMFEAMSKCQSLHPDPADDSPDDEDEEGEEEEEEEGMFDDAEEEEENGEGTANGGSGGGASGEPMDAQ